MRLLNMMARWLIAMLMAGLAATLLTLPAAAQTTAGAAKPAATAATTTATTPTTDRAYVLVEGRVAHEGPAAGLFDDPAVAALYLGGRPRAA